MKRAAVPLAVVAALCLGGCGDPSQIIVRAHIDEGPSASSSPVAATPATTLAEVGAAPCRSGTPPQGLEVWRRGFADDDVLQVTSVATDAEGNTFVARAVGGTFKVSGTGAVLWSKPFGSLVAADTAGNAIVAGTFSGTLALGAKSLTAVGGADAYVAKLDSSGNVLYAVALGGAPDEHADSVAVDGQGSVVVSGGGIGTVKLDSAGRTVWTKAFHGSVAIDSTDSIVMTGALTGTVSFGGDPLQSAGGEDVFVAKLDGAGNHLFSRRFGDEGSAQHGESISVDPRDNILVGGVLDGAVDFGGGPLSVRAGSCPPEGWCKQAGFVLELDASGHHLWSRSAAPVRSMPGIAADSQGNVFASGAYPGDAPPYRTLLLLEFNQEGSDLGIVARLDGELTAAGAGHRIAVDRCDNVLWSFSTPPAPGQMERSFLTKLAP